MIKIPNAVGGVATNPTISNPPAALTASTVVPRADGFGQATDPFLFDLGTQTAFSVASMTTVITGSPASVTLQLQGSVDGNNWTTLATSTSTSGDTQWAAGGVNQFTLLRVNCSALSGGTNPKVQLALSAFASSQGTSGTQPVSGTVTANQGTANTAANGWPVKLTDGSNTLALSAINGSNFIPVVVGSGSSFTSLTAATGTGAGTAFDFGAAWSNVTLQLSGTSTSVQVDLEGSLDNSNFFKLTVDTAATVATPRAVTSTGKPVRYIRGNVITIANGNVTGKLMVGG